MQTTLGPIVTKIIVPPSSLSKTKKRKRAEKASQDKSPEDTVEEMDNILNKLKLEDVNASNKVSLVIMALWVVEFSREGYKTRYIFGQKSISSKDLETLNYQKTSFHTKKCS